MQVVVRGLSLLSPDLAGKSCSGLLFPSSCRAQRIIELGPWNMRGKLSSGEGKTEG